MSKSFNDADRRAFAEAASAATIYREGLGTRPIGPVRGYEQKLADFAEPLANKGMPSDEVIRQLVDIGSDGLMDMVSPRFFGWVLGASHSAGTAADILSAGWAQVATMAIVTPTASAVEEVAGKWLLDILDLPRESSIGFTTGATVANATGLAAARNELLHRVGWDVEAKGLFGAPEISVVVGGEVHSSVGMSLRMIGFGADRVIVASSDSEGRMKPDSLKAVTDDIDGPLIIIAQAGSINAGAIDPMDEIADIAAEKGAWLHVDGAFGLWAHAHPEYKALAKGVDRADSWAVDGHKWLQVPYDCGFVFVKNQAAHVRAMGHSAAYLPNSATLRDPGDYVPELSRRSRGLPVWAVMKALGRDGIVDMIGRNCRLALRMADALSQEQGVCVLNDVTLNQVAVTFGPKGETGDLMTQEVLEQVQKEGFCYPSVGLWKNRQTLRISISGYATTDDDADKSVKSIINAWRKVKDQNE